VISEEKYNQYSWDDIPLSDWPDLGAIATYTKDNTDKLTVHFKGDVKNGPAQNAQYSWNFGDQTTSSEQNPTHTYAAMGTYSVQLTVTDYKGRTAQHTENIRLTKAKSISKVTVFEKLISVIPMLKQIFMQIFSRYNEEIL